MQPDFSEKTRFKSTPKTIRLTDLLKVEEKNKEPRAALTTATVKEEYFTDAALLAAWKTFAETIKTNQADYQLMSQPYERQGEKIIVPLANPIQETMLNEFKTALNTFLREQLNNTKIVVEGELRTVDERKILYSPREKFEYLVNKNPMIKELKDRLALDPDF